MKPGTCLDEAAVEKLLKMGGPGFVVKMIDNFVSYVPQKLTEARAAERAGLLDDIRKAAHPIKSSAGHVGAHAMQELASRVEQMAVVQPLAETSALLSDLEAEFVRVKACLDEKRRTFVS
jgi:HPt (histidine-containing phosphotransfer) domain-containing protein